MAAVSWKLLPTDTVSLSVTVPVSVTATVSVPLLALDASTATVSEGSSKVWAGGKFVPTAGVVSAALSVDKTAVIFDVLSGYYEFETSKQPAFAF